MLNLTEIVTSLDQDEDVHLARILLLLLAFYNDSQPAIVGITKLAKLDFLLRYPSYLERALRARGVPQNRMPIESYERLTVEARMVRYRFGPWDHRYRRFLNILAARGLVSLRTDGRTVLIDLTDRGTQFAKVFSEREEFSKVFVRAQLLKKHLDLKARRLMEFIYEEFPEIASLEFDDGIVPRSVGSSES